MNETKPTNHTPTIALGVAALLLLVVAGMSYKDYIRKSLQKEFDEKQKQFVSYGQQQQQGYQQQAPAYPQNQQYPRNQRATNQFPANGNAQAPNQPAVGAQQQGIDRSRLPQQSNLPKPRDPEMARLEENLAKVTAQAKETERRYNELSKNVTPSTAPTQATTPTAKISPELQNALQNPPGGNPEIMDSLTRMKKQVMSSPAIGRVLSYDKEWGIVAFDAGKDRGVKKDQRFAIRRGNDVLGWVKVDEVYANQAIAHMVIKGANSDMTLKPQAGDDLIQFEL